MSRTRLTAVAMLTGATGLSAVANSIGAVVATIALGPEQRGAMVLVLTIGTFVSMIAPLGTGTALRAQLPRADEEGHRRSLLTSYTWLSLSAGVVGAAIAIAAARLSASIIDATMADVRLLVAVAIATFAQVLLGQSNDLFFAVGDFRGGAAWNLAAVTSGLIGLVAAVAISAETWLLLLLQGIGLLAVATLRWNQLQRRGLALLAAPSRRVVHAMLRQGVPSLGLNIGLAVAQRADRYILGIVAGTAAVGIYSLGATLSGMASLIPLSIGQLSQRDAATRTMRSWPGRHVTWALASASLTSMLIALGGWLLLVPVFGPEFAPARHLLVPLLVAEISLAPYWVAARALLGGGWSRTAGIIGAVSAVASIALYGTATPIWGMGGAAAACIVLYAGLSLLTTVLLARRLGETGNRPKASMVPKPTADRDVSRTSGTTPASR